MPKDRRSRSVSFERPSPFSSRSSSRRGYSPHPSSSSSPTVAPSSSRIHPLSVVLASKDVKEWDEVRCPVCMEHPHNAVLLICTSQDKGCRPFMCDTSYRHSNCLDQYRKSFDTVVEAEIKGESKVELSCPLCRGVVSGWKVVEAARKYMNAKARSCSTEYCIFAGAYDELRRHARTAHPLVRPSEADPERQRDWQRIEQQRNLGDLFSTVHSAFGGEEDDLGFLLGDREFDGRLAFPTITFFLVLRFSESAGSFRRGSSRSSSRSHRVGEEAHWGNLMDDAEAAGVPLNSAEDDVDPNYHLEDDDQSSDSRYGIIPGNSRRQQRQNHRPLTMIDDEEDENEADDV